jgi:DNA-directed RNA polymerase alpha subunit
MFPCPNPNCKGFERRVLESRYEPNRAAIRRRCICKSCRFTFTTEERVRIAKKGQRPITGASDQPLVPITLEARLDGIETELAAVRLEMSQVPQTAPVPIQELELGAYAYGSLRRQGIATIEDLVKRSDADLLRLRNFGHCSLEEVQVALALRGLALRGGMSQPAPVALQFSSNHPLI